MTLTLDGSGLDAGLDSFPTSDLEDCDHCHGKTFPGHLCDGEEP